MAAIDQFPLPWHLREIQQMHEILVRNYPTQEDTEALLEKIQVDPADVPIYPRRRDT